MSNPFASWTAEDVARHNAKAGTPRSSMVEQALYKGQVTGSIPVAATVTVRKSTDEANLNKLEASWLAILRARGYPWIGVQSITLKLANDTRYTPDFSSVGPNGEFIFWETKGFFRDDAKVKLKIAARQYSWAVFMLVEKKKGQWIETEIKP